MENIKIIEKNAQLDVQMADISGSQIRQAMMNDVHLQDVMITRLKIVDANLSDLEIEGAQLGGAYIHNIGMPPEGHPAYDPNAKQRPLKFENCDLNGTTISNCDLSNVVISDCDLSGMKINGILVTELLLLKDL